MTGEHRFHAKRIQPCLDQVQFGLCVMGEVIDGNHAGDAIGAGDIGDMAFQIRHAAA